MLDAGVVFQGFQTDLQVPSFDRSASYTRQAHNIEFKDRLFVLLVVGLINNDWFCGEINSENLYSLSYITVGAALEKKFRRSEIHSLPTSQILCNDDVIVTSPQKK